MTMLWYGLLGDVLYLYLGAGITGMIFFFTKLADPLDLLLYTAVTISILFVLLRQSHRQQF